MQMVTQLVGLRKVHRGVKFSLSLFCDNNCTHCVTHTEAYKHLIHLTYPTAILKMPYELPGCLYF